MFIDIKLIPIFQKVVNFRVQFLYEWRVCLKQFVFVNCKIVWQFVHFHKKYMEMLKAKLYISLTYKDSILPCGYKRIFLYFFVMLFRYLQPPAEWISCALESRELLALCLKRLKGLQRVKLVDAGFAWTEPHSKRIKV